MSISLAVANIPACLTICFNEPDRSFSDIAFERWTELFPAHRFGFSVNFRTNIANMSEKIPSTPNLIYYQYRIQSSNPSCQTLPKAKVFGISNETFEESPKAWIDFQISGKIGSYLLMHYIAHRFITTGGIPSEPADLSILRSRIMRIIFVFLKEILSICVITF